MPVYQSYGLIEQLQQQTENFLQEAISEWQMMPPALLLQQPEPGKWSAVQCLAHLNSYGKYYLPAIEKSLQKAKKNSWSSKEQFAAGWLGNYFTNLMKPDTEGKKMKKMKAPKNHSPIPDLNADKVVGEFIDQQEKLLKLLEKAKKIDLEKARVPISIAKFIKLKLGDTFMFLITHNHRHVLQAKRAIADALNGEKNGNVAKQEKVIV